MTKIKFLKIFLIIVIAVGVFWAFQVEKSDSAWDTNCGLVKNTKTKCYGPFICKVKSEKIIETPFYKYWIKTHGQCEKHNWVSFHGRSDGLLTDASYSGLKPIWYVLLGFSKEADYLEYIYQNDPALLKEILEYSLESRLQSKGYDTEILWVLLDFWGDYKSYGVTEETDIKALRTWWETYKVENKL